MTRPHLAELRNGQVAMLVCHESALVDIARKYPIEYIRIRNCRASWYVCVEHIERLQPKDKRFDVMYDIFDVVFPEVNDCQTYRLKSVSANHWLAQWLAQNSLDNLHVLLANLLRDEDTTSN